LRHSQRLCFHHNRRRSRRAAFATVADLVGELEKMAEQSYAKLKADATSKAN